MFDKDNILEILESKCEAIDLFAIKQQLNRTPYFELLRLAYLKELKRRDEELFLQELKESAIFFSDRKFAYRFINGSSGGGILQSYDTAVVSSDYFALEGADTSSESLRHLARKLKQARMAKIEALKQTSNLDEATVCEDVKQLICNQRYGEALRLLKKINFNNSEKSVYFALQKKYLETIVNFRG